MALELASVGVEDAVASVGFENVALIEEGHEKALADRSDEIRKTSICFSFVSFRISFNVCSMIVDLVGW